MPTEYPGTPPEVPDPHDAPSGSSGASPGSADENAPTTRHRRPETPGAPGDSAPETGNTARFDRSGAGHRPTDATPTGPGTTDPARSTGIPGAAPATDDADWWAHPPQPEQPSGTTGPTDTPAAPQWTLPLPGAPDLFPRADSDALSATVDPGALSVSSEPGSLGASPTPGRPGAFPASGTPGLSPDPGAPTPPPEPGSAATTGAPPRSMSGGSNLRGAEPPRKVRGSVRRQQVGVTQARDPSLGEARAREKGRERAAAAEKMAEERLEAKRRNRKRTMIGGAAVVGVAALVGAGYLAYSAANQPREVTAYCVTDDNGQQTVVSDDDCVKAQDYVSTYGGGGYGGGVYPIFLYNGHQYRYYYGGSNAGIGSHPRGGSFSAPSHSVSSTKSGTTVRGGLGVKGGGKSGGS
ncbi:hypothetical protein [Nocardia sp. alder85J]|uniref:hypothetical protein n=1 Tax=Nocardia sp. alder85J TaxID=2862949 RepID=UPI001CD4AC4B|nr:hypothetical protein [Nocardia sp. alder85J]MCX4094042.1 hypothetical protein [Nocardia sp. alder85J]